MRGVKLLVMLAMVVAAGLTAWGQCGTLEQAHAAIIELARAELGVFEQAYGVSFNWRATRVSTYGDALVMAVPVMEPPSGFYPGDIVAGYVVRGIPGRPSGAFGLQLGDGPRVNVVGAWRDVLRIIPVCDPRFENCFPEPDMTAFPIVRFRPAAEEENCCYDCYTFCWGWPPNVQCEDHCSWTCPCPDK